MEDKEDHKYIQAKIQVDVTSLEEIKWPPTGTFINIYISIFIPHATSCGGYNVFDPSVSQSVSPSVLFFCQLNPSMTMTMILFS